MGARNWHNVLLNQLNDLRLSWPSTELAIQMHSRVYPLQCTLLERLNNKQGLGFAVAGKVIDKRTLNVILISAVSFLLFLS